MIKKAQYIKKSGNGWRCVLCPQNCLWTEKTPLGKCRIRGLFRGEPSAIGYGECVSLSMDPIEKKPLYHFLPGRKILSTGPPGCNLSCSFCQNWTISQNTPKTRFVEPDLLAEMANRDNSCGIAFTYTEPSIWFEYIADVSPLVRKTGGVVVMVSNGFINPEPLSEYIHLTDAWNIDLKSWSDEFYSNLCNGNRKVVLNTISRLAESECHLEVTFLIIPGENDKENQWHQMGKWLADNAGETVALHISRYFPRYKLQKPPTELSTLQRARDVFSKYMKFVYMGNVYGKTDTYCDSCGNILISRNDYSTDVKGIINGRCSACGADVKSIFRIESG